jgi:HAMP domain-containing protein/HPt (histidine-containing phosphotransfer) domain-containing protein
VTTPGTGKTPITLDTRGEPRVLDVRQTVRAKLVRTMIATLSLITVAVIATVAVLHVWTARGTLALIEAKIEDSIIRKGQGLVSNHAQALRGLVADNAFSDVRRLVEGALSEDSELAYGLYVDTNMQPWAYVSPTTRPIGEPGKDVGKESAGKESSKDRWKAASNELGLDNNVLYRPARRSLVRRQLFGQEIFQFSAPVLDDSGQPTGSIIYGVWAAPLETALARARADSRTSLILASVFLTGLTAFATLVGWWLVRKAAARITHPIVELTRATAALAAGDRHLRVSIQSRDEIETLGHAFNQMVGELDESYARLEGLNHTLEARVEQRTRELGDRNRDLRLVLDTVDEGLVTVSRNGLLAQERSSMIDLWFGSYTGQTRFVDFIGKIDPAFAERFALGFDAMLEDVLVLELYLEQMPTRIVHAGRKFKCTYLPITEGEQVQGLLIVINDITDQLLLAQQDAEQRELLALFQGFTRDRLGFLSLFDEASAMVGQVAAGRENFAVHRRLIHTLKGNAMLASLNVIGDLCHRAEDEVDEAQTVVVTPTILALRDRWEKLVQALRGLQGERGREVIEVNAQEIELICQELAGTLAANKIVEKLNSWRQEPTIRPFERLAEYTRALAQRLGRGEVDVQIDGGGVRLDPVSWGPFWSEMIHLIRNAVDHGLEAPAERASLGKPARPTVRLAARTLATGLVIEVEDDGRGIDWDAIRRAANGRQLPADSEADLLAALLTDGISARDRVSSTSGRGVGMSALHGCVRRFGGEISVVSRRNQGTCWRMSFPLSVLGGHGGGKGGQVAVSAALA